MWDKVLLASTSSAPGNWAQHRAPTKALPAAPVLELTEAGGMGKAGFTHPTPEL